MSRVATWQAHDGTAARDFPPARARGAVAEDFRSRLTPEQYAVTQEGATEPAFSHPFATQKADGTYACVCCGATLFTSDQKFDSGSGWPSFWAPGSGANVTTRADTTHGMMRIEVNCGSCGAHLGHMFPDGPAPTGMRYCINGCALDFRGRRPEAP